ncbi:glycosyltransferase family 4 protein [Chitinophaga pendula]|uniref:glycosyltransferase family 4 protein n=1 Tax=Chitinophaga TaxID=79328 RepID=UPI000BB0A94C|nr:MULTISPECIES: glycosyltransferase [Chitinophaga]ASZ10115.1 hypothetical protein CK934_03530 [Chitinophaga sp. MD30]UCJ06931.1 glycosyltransferase family 4 protein [Chitinophaga pendula]
MNKRVLYFMPDNPLKKTAGNNIPPLKLLQYFKDRNIPVDFVSEYHWGEWDEQKIQTFKESGIANDLYVLDRKPYKKTNKLRYFFLHKLPALFSVNKFGIIPPAIPDNVTPAMRKAFNMLLKQQEYGYIIISYVTWANLIKHNRYATTAYKIIDTHDFITAQVMDRKGFRLGKAFEEEVKRLDMFDESWCLSIEERYIFSHFGRSKQRLGLPIFDNVRLPAVEKKYDLIYIASENIHNRRAAAWFFEKVYPLLPSHLRICLIGRINHSVTGQYSNVDRVLFAETLEQYYAQSKVAICPMLSGTGIKIKTIEALSFGLPVVCNTKGIDGMPDKSRNGCLVSDEPETFAAHIMQLLTDQHIYNQQQQWARETISMFFATSQRYNTLDQVFGVKGEH